MHLIERIVGPLGLRNRKDDDARHPVGVHPDDERLITIEDAGELRLAKPHVVSLEARPANVEGRGEVTVGDLVRNALRTRPDRIIAGEVRGGSRDTSGSRRSGG